jgi:hypothetical protein
MYLKDISPVHVPDKPILVQFWILMIYPLDLLEANT